MRTVIGKWFWIWDFDKEEAWLSEMAAKGFALVSVGFCRYEFEDCTPGAYNVRLEMLENVPTHPESRTYIEFLEDTGAEQVGSRLRWIYLRRRAEYGPFELFSDNASRIKHLTGIIRLLLAVFLPELYLGLYNLAVGLGMGLSVNIILGAGVLCLAALIGYGLYRLTGKRRRLREEAAVFE